MLDQFGAGLFDVFDQMLADLSSGPAPISQVRQACYRPRYLNIRRLNYLWTIRHSSARIAGNLVT